MNHIQPQINTLQPYRPGMTIPALARAYNLDPQTIVKLTSNENPRGMSPRITQSSISLIDDMNRYPDAQTLIEALAQKHDVDVGNIILGNGSNDVLDLIARVFLGPDAQAISSQYAFSIYQLLTNMTGATNIVVDAIDYGHNLEAMAAAITSTTRVIWIANPNNPTGTFVPASDLKHFMTNIPEHVVVVLDEAYYEYLDNSQRTDSISWIGEFPRLIVTRTFSKAYGLAGFRVGYAVAHPDTIELLNRVRQPFNVNQPAIRAACIALDDTEFVQDSYTHNQAGLRQLTDGFDALGLTYIPSFGNFVAVEFGDAAAVHESLLRRGIIVRPLQEYTLPHHLRISVGLPDENNRLLTALAEIL